ncbi:DUF1080 domain-containing protein [Echinicola jeungdonensis]|uniref:DUF1080 domain-containing protein n=1 Tax=Echinicola jeungdonensis TaxID=709343 RepID=A0ABV5J3V2_9BACT|nr:DUF1080 domain-containing protein [Echinicola jeungdonensis]MDN3670668.1 DUF1080 domain-containing protein [Echinicola jeungdonensis]
MDTYNQIPKILSFVLCVLAFAQVKAQEQKGPQMTPEMTEFWDHKVPIISPGEITENAAMTAPSDALVLFDGKDLSKWESVKGGPAKWIVENGVFTVNKGTGDIQTIEKFNDFQLHIEWKVPENITGKSQFRGNSGIYLQGRYELQVLDNYNNPTYSNGQAGSIYKQTPPLKNAMRAPGEWNVYDIIYTAPRFKEDKTLFSPGRVTVIHNGVVIQNNTQIKGHTPFTGLPKYTYHEKGSIKLQDHGDPSEPISYRNIWIREL